MLWVLTLFLAAGGPGEPAAAPTAIPPAIAAPRGPSIDEMLVADWRRVRVLDGRLRQVLAEGARRSGTFASLVRAIHETDVIVYIEASFGLPSEMAGRLLLQAVTNGDRYLRVQVRGTLRPDQMIATIAHELRHALEVAGEPLVISDEALRALYQRIGHTSSSTRGFETRAAIDAGETVRAELYGRTPVRTAARQAAHPAGM